MRWRPEAAAHLPGGRRAVSGAAPPASRLLRIACGDGPAGRPGPRRPLRPLGSSHQGPGPRACPTPRTAPQPPLAAYREHGKGHLPALLQRPVEPKAFQRSECPVSWRPTAGRSTGLAARPVSGGAGVTADATPPGGGRDRGHLPLLRGLWRAERDGRGGHTRRVAGAGAPNPPQDGGKGTQPPYRPRTAGFAATASPPQLRRHSFAATASRRQLRGQATDGLLTILLDIFKLDPWMWLTM